MENQLKVLIDWLIHFEEKAAVIFSRLAEALKDDEALASFLRQLSEDEETHARHMRDAVPEMKDMGQVPPITLDGETRAKMVAPFDEIERMLSENSLSKERVIECMIETEFSEYNDFFLFAMESLKADNKEIQYTAAMIDKHRNSIEEFLSTLPGGEGYAEKIKSLSPIWKARVLIVENDVITAKLLGSVLKGFGLTEVVGNGEEGLKKVMDNYYDVILSDYDMPVMDGIAFFRKVVEKEPEIKERIVFFSGMLTDEETTFLDKEGVRYLEKPSSVKEIRETVAGIIG